MMNKVPRQFTFMADYGIGCCIWTKEGGVSLDYYGFPAHLCTRADRWLGDYFENEEPPVSQTREEYNQEGLFIAQEIKSILGLDYIIKYRFISPTKNSQGELVWEEIIL